MRHGSRLGAGCSPLLLALGLVWVSAAEGSFELHTNIFAVEQKPVNLRVGGALPVLHSNDNNGPKRLLQARIQDNTGVSIDDDRICYEGCYEAPDINADPFPIFLLAGSVRGAECVSLEDCYMAAKLNNMTYFGIMDEMYCFGGTSFSNVQDNWIESTQCKLSCIPGVNKGGNLGACGGPNLGTFFSLGDCVYSPPPATPAEPAPPLPPPASPDVPPTDSPDTLTYKGCLPTGSMADAQFVDVGTVPNFAACLNFATENLLTTFAVWSSPGGEVSCQIQGSEFDYSGLLVGDGQCNIRCNGGIAVSCGGGETEFYSTYLISSGEPTPSPETIPSPPPPSPEATSTPAPTDGKRYWCKKGVALWGVASRKTHQYGEAACRKRCDREDDCAGYYYKTTGWCYRVSKVYDFSKPYGTAVQACRVVRQKQQQ